MFALSFIKNMFIGVLLFLIAKDCSLIVPAMATLLVSIMYLNDAFLYIWAMCRGIFPDENHIIYITISLLL